MNTKFPGLKSSLHTNEIIVRVQTQTQINDIQTVNKTSDIGGRE